MANELAQIPARNMIAMREEFSANERRLSAEMSAIVLAARAKAEVESRRVRYPFATCNSNHPRENYIVSHRRFTKSTGRRKSGPRSTGRANHPTTHGIR